MNVEVLSRLRGKLIISCQDYESVMISAAIKGGAAGLRLNGPQAVQFARAITALPILACNKMFFPNSEVYITPSVRTARSLIKAGADLVAFDARALPRPRESTVELIDAIHAGERMAVADVATLEEGLDARRRGADVIATTFSPNFSPELIRQLATAGCTVLAEGHINSPDQVAQAIDSGAWSVCIGTAITRPHIITSQFRQVLE